MPECGVVADHLLSSCLPVWTLKGDSGQGQIYTTTGISHSALFRTGGKTLIAFLISTLDLPCYTFGFFFLFIEYFAEHFSVLENGDSLQAEGEPLHPNQTAERTSAHWHYSHTFLEHFFFFFISTALHCSLRVHRRLVAFFLHRERREDTGGSG